MHENMLYLCRGKCGSDQCPQWSSSYDACSDGERPGHCSGHVTPLQCLKSLKVCSLCFNQIIIFTWKDTRSAINFSSKLFNTVP